MTEEGENLTNIFSPSEIFHENTKLRRYDVNLARRIGLISMDMTIQKELGRFFKRYLGTKTIPFPKDLPKSPYSFEEIILRRRSIRQFSGDPLTLPQVANLLQLGNGITAEFRDANGELIRYLRAAPSGGGLYPIELYLAAFKVEGLEAGLYHYDVKGNQLEFLNSCEPDRIESAIFFEGAEKMAALIIMTAIFPRIKFKYGELGYRFALLEAGHIAQNILLAAASLDLGACPLGGFFEDEINQMLGIDGVDETTLYMIAIGRKEGEPVSQKEAFEQKRDRPKTGLTPEEQDRKAHYTT